MQQSIRRPEIQGLRALAVGAVLLFHAGFSFVSGGFLGVDIFFVISGFLITGNIARDIESGIFNPWHFWGRRIRRLQPALAVTTLVTMIAAYFVFPPDEVVGLGRSAVAAIFSVSNILFWSKVGYFDIGAHLKPLLHTWSLGVEEQLYLVWPLLLLACARLRGKESQMAVVVGLGILSFGSIFLIGEADRSAAFYLMPFRMFEFCIGGALSFSRFKANVWRDVPLFVLGLAAIFYSILNFNSSMRMPGVFSLVPCFGTALVIVSGNVPVLGRLLANRLMTFIGDISYSLYLVHWPIVVFSSEVLGDGAWTWWSKLLILAICLLSAVLLYYLVEDRFKSAPAIWAPLDSRRAFAGCSIMVAAVVLIFGHIWISDGWRFRLPDELKNIPTASEMWKKRGPTVRIGSCFLTARKTFSDFDSGKCLALSPEKPNYLILGDSTAADLYSVFSQAYPNANFLEATSGNCKPVLGNQRDDNCRKLLDFIFHDFVMRTKLDGIILNGIWFHIDLAPLQATVDYLKKINPHVMVVGADVTFRENVPSLIFKSRGTTIEDAEKFVFSHRPARAPVNQLLVERFSKQVFFVDLEEDMLSKGQHVFTEDGQLIFIDFAHLTTAGATYLAKIVAARHPLTSWWGRSPESSQPNARH